MGDNHTSKGFAVVIGMSIAYAASLIGMIFAYVYYKKNKAASQSKKEEDKKWSASFYYKHPESARQFWASLYLPLFSRFHSLQPIY